MTNYNHARYIGEQLQAILDQLYKPIEIVIIDDCSTDNSVEVIESFAQKEPTLRFFRNPKNLGTVVSGNLALEKASGDYIYWAAADDRVLPCLFMKSMSLLAQYPQAGLCCSHPAFLDDATGAIERHEDWFHLGRSPRYLPPDEVLKVVPDIWIAGHTSIMKRSALLEAKHFIPELRWHADWFALYAIAFRYGICYTPEPLATQRVLPTSYSNAGMKDPILQQQVVEYLAHLLQSSPYQDIKAAFQKSNVLSVFFPEHQAFLQESLQASPPQLQALPS